MNKLDKILLAAIMPSSIASDQTVQNIAKTLDARLLDNVEEIERLLLLPNLDNLPEPVIDELVYQYHVDSYGAELSLEAKRNLVRGSVFWHRRKGTPAAVEAVCKAIFQSAQITEWWEYGGEPYHFSVKGVENPTPNPKAFVEIVKAIKATKNTRSWLDEIGMLRRIRGGLYLGTHGHLHKKISLGMAIAKPAKMSGVLYYGVANNIHRKVEM